jgi:hypothetical protein
VVVARLSLGSCGSPPCATRTAHGNLNDCLHHSTLTLPHTMAMGCIERRRASDQGAPNASLDLDPENELASLPMALFQQKRSEP